MNRAEGFRAGRSSSACRRWNWEYTGFTQPIQPRPIRELTIELEINRRHGDEDRAADAEGKRALRAKVTQDIYAQRASRLAPWPNRPSSPSWVRHRPAAPKQLVAGNYFAEQRQFNLRMQASSASISTST